MKNSGNDKLQFMGGALKRVDIDRLKLPAMKRFAFAGRSNVGKSSLLNALTGIKLARVSSEPGRTREINFFLWKPKTDKRSHGLLVDLPGYGYAKVAKTLREEWGSFINEWMLSDEHLAHVFALVDGRHGYMASDQELVEFLRASHIPFTVVFTKMDKWKSQNQRRGAEAQLRQFSQKLAVENFVFTSAHDPKSMNALKRICEESRKESDV